MTRVHRELRRLFWDLTVNGIIRSGLVAPQVRWLLLRAFGFPMERCNIAGGVWFGGPGVTIGRGSYVNFGCWFDPFAPIVIDERVRLGPHVRLVTSTHELGGPEQRASDGVVTAPIHVGAGSWIGAGATVLPGVVIGEGCVVAAGAVVREDCKPNALYAGVPAVWVRDLGE